MGRIELNRKELKLMAMLTWWIACLWVSVALAAPATEKINTSYISVAPSSSAHIWVAKDARLFEKHGLDATVIFISGSIRGIQSILAGEIPIGEGGGPGLTSARLAGGDVVALAGNNRQERPVSGPFVRGELYDVHRSEVFIGSSFRVRLTHGDLATFNRWIGAVCGVEARSADHVGSDFYYLLSAEDEATSLPGGLVVRNGSVVEIWFSEFIEAGINASAQRALAEIQELVDRALNAVA